MADPLHSRDFREFEFDTRTSEPVGTGLEQNRENTVAYQAPLEDPILKGTMRPERELPEAGNPRLNRTAEQIGSALGKAVTHARRVPDTARRGLHVVRDRAQEAGDGAAAQISSSASSLAGSAQQRARDWADSAQQKARELVDVAEERGRVLLDKADDLGQNVAQRAGEIKQQLDERTRELRAKARLSVQQARWRGERLIQERPLQVLAGIAGAAFVVGVS